MKSMNTNDMLVSDLVTNEVTDVNGGCGICECVEEWIERLLH